MKVVVAGATGLIGSGSVTRLRDHGAQVVPLALGADRVASGCLRAKAAQQDLVRRSALPCSLGRATPLFESVASAVCAGVYADGVHVAPAAAVADRVAAPSPTSPSWCRCSAFLAAAGPKERPFDLDHEGHTCLAARAGGADR
ncbi:hypothetical protein GCM10010269_78640 [Streptomyces humidus]|uniref:NAD-dependent epimerase/dehydratase family protein n=1 Tax=Streptomyces humidus TaxID=52259 RepID=A0A918LC39_9ACTN|nr:hypothetical protein [Streptomyces humidus]GGS28291.1 hypothetical protein GCM10010269_78640 [Streptomyces humidus]